MSYRKIKNNLKTQKNKTWHPEQIKTIWIVWIVLGDLFLISLSTQFFFMILVCGLLQALFIYLFVVL
jgi:hypothetical protein